MIFHETPLRGAFLLEIDRREDERGFFARTFAREEFEERGLIAAVAQTSIAWNAARGTIRGMHLQYPPYAEVKLVRCTRGAIYDVIVDVRPESQTYLQNYSVHLDDKARLSLYVPERFAHGYQVIADGTEVAYQMSAAYVADAQVGLRFDDSRLGIKWPLPITVVSARDRSWPLLAIVEQEFRDALALAGP